MTTLSTIKAEAVAKLVELMTASIKENERRDCPYCDFKPGEFRPGKSLVMHMASIHRDKYKTKIEQVSDLLLSEIDRAVGAVVREKIRMAPQIGRWPNSHPAECVCIECEAAVEKGLIHDLLQKLSTLKEK